MKKIKYLLSMLCIFPIICFGGLDKISDELNDKTSHVIIRVYNDFVIV